MEKIKKFYKKYGKFILFVIVSIVVILITPMIRNYFLGNSDNYLLNQVSFIISYALSIIISYVLNKLIVFRTFEKDYGETVDEMSLFVGLRIVTIAIYVLLSILFTHIFTVNVGVILAEIIVLLLNYRFAKNVVFKS